MIIKIDWKKLIISLLIPLAVGGLSAFITRSDMDVYKRIEQPPLAPPSWVFPVVWSILFFLMGISLYIVWISRARPIEKRNAYIFFALQLFMNFIWSPIFFSLQQYLLAFVVLVILWLFILAMLVSFYRISPIAGILQIPYLIWVTFAGYLNLGIYILNR